MAGIHLKTENYYSKGRRTQIIHMQVGTQEMQGFPLFKIILDPDTQMPKRVPNTWEKPIIKKQIIHHNL